MEMDRVSIKIPGIGRKHTFFHISDAHVVCSAPDDTSEDKELAEKHTKKWQLTDKTPKEAYEEVMAHVNAVDCDGIFITGDCIDYYRPSIAAYMRDSVSACNKDVLYVYGNHEGGDYAKKTDSRAVYSEFAPIMHNNPAFWAKDYDGFTIVGIDNSLKEITTEQMTFLKEQSKRGIPLILLIHVPLDTPVIRESVIKRWGGDISQRQYFILGFDDTTPKSGMEFAEFVKSEQSNIIAVFSGHIHYTCQGEFAKDRIQFTAESAASGYVRQIDII